MSDLINLTTDRSKFERYEQTTNKIWQAAMGIAITTGILIVIAGVVGALATLKAPHSIRGDVVFFPAIIGSPIILLTGFIAAPILIYRHCKAKDFKDVNLDDKV